jgi:hypothetical protein
VTHIYINRLRIETPSTTKLVLKNQADNESTNSYLVERSLRASDAKKGISALITKQNPSITLGVALILCHATSMDANELIILSNSFVRGTFQCLDTKPMISGRGDECFVSAACLVWSDGDYLCLGTA